jgi:hypothetical protein
MQIDETVRLIARPGGRLLWTIEPEPDSRPILGIQLDSNSACALGPKSSSTLPSSVVIAAAIALTQAQRTKMTAVSCVWSLIWK